jgi:hypothetical protein
VIEESPALRAADDVQRLPRSNATHREPLALIAAPRVDG